MKKSIKNVLSLSAIAAVAMMPFAVNAAEVKVEGGSVDSIASAYTAETVTLEGDLVVATGDFKIDAATDDVVVDLGGKTLKLVNGQFKVDNTGHKTTVKNGTIQCQVNANGCVTAAASTDLELIDVTVTSDKDNAVSAAAKLTIENGVYNGSVAATGTFKVKGTVTGPASLVAKAADNTKINVNAVTATDTDVGDDFSNLTATGLTVDFSRVDFTNMTKVPTGYTLKYSKSLGNPQTITGVNTTVMQLSETNTVGTYYVKTLDKSAFDVAKGKFDAKYRDDKQKMVDKYGTLAVENANTSANTVAGLTDARSIEQSTVNTLTNTLNNMAELKDLSAADKDLIGNEPVQPTNPDTPNTPADETINKNPQTSDSIYSVASLALVGISALGVAAKKRFN